MNIVQLKAKKIFPNSRTRPAVLEQNIILKVYFPFPQELVKTEPSPTHQRISLKSAYGLWMGN